MIFRCLACLPRNEAHFFQPIAKPRPAFGHVGQHGLLAGPQIPAYPIQVAHGLECSADKRKLIPPQTNRGNVALERAADC